MQLGETTESTDLTQLDSFVGPPGTGAPMAQVWYIRATPGLRGTSDGLPCAGELGSGQRRCVRSFVCTTWAASTGPPPPAADLRR